MDSILIYRKLWKYEFESHRLPFRSFGIFVSIEDMLVNSLHAIIAEWLNASQRSQVGVGMNRSARLWSVKHSHFICTLAGINRLLQVAQSANHTNNLVSQVQNRQWHFVFEHAECFHATDDLLN